MDSLEASFKVLGISSLSTADQVKKTYRKLALQHHPDKRGPEGTAKFQEIQRAYEIALSRASSRVGRENPAENTANTQRSAPRASSTTQPVPPPKPASASASQPAPASKSVPAPAPKAVPAPKPTATSSSPSITRPVPRSTPASTSAPPKPARVVPQPPLYRRPLSPPPPPPADMWYERPTSSDFPRIIRTLRRWFATQYNLVPEASKNKLNNLPVTKRITETLDRLNTILKDSDQKTMARYIGREMILLKHYWVICTRESKSSAEEIRASMATFMDMAAETKILPYMVGIDKVTANEAFTELERSFNDPKV